MVYTDPAKCQELTLPSEFVRIPGLRVRWQLDREAHAVWLNGVPGVAFNVTDIRCQRLDALVLIAEHRPETPVHASFRLLAKLMRN